MRRHAVGFGGKTVEADDQTEVNRDDTTIYERERVRINRWFYGILHHATARLVTAGRWLVLHDDELRRTTA